MCIFFAVVGRIISCSSKCLIRFTLVILSLKSSAITGAIVDLASVQQWL